MSPDNPHDADAADGAVTRSFGWFASDVMPPERVEELLAEEPGFRDTSEWMDEKAPTRDDVG